MDFADLKEIPVLITIPQRGIQKKGDPEKGDPEKGGSRKRGIQKKGSLSSDLKVIFK